jgi:phosphopantetheinyl transferase (holo-ACP synthase)
LDLKTPIELDGNKFTVTGKKKKYFFKAKKEEHQHSASEWVEKIKEAISKAFY